MEMAMCLKELMDELRLFGITPSDPQIRWAIKTGKIARPRVDGSFRFDFSSENVAEIAAYFSKAGESLRKIIERFPNAVMFGDDSRLARKIDRVNPSAEGEAESCK